MACIKKFNSTTQQWEVVSTTNARGIRIDNENLYDRGNNISDILESLQTDVNDLKQNVTWLAKYGGGGAGGGGGMGGSTIDASILVNGKPTNSEITIGKDGLNIEIQCSNQKLLWNITAVANASIQVKGVSNAKSLNIKLTEWEKVVKGGATLNITAYNAQQVINIYWNGKINVSSVKLEGETQVTALYSKFNDTSLVLSYTIGSTGVYKMYVNDVALDNGRPYYQLNGVYSANCGDINNALKTETTDFFIVGINKLKFKFEDVNNTEIFYEFNIDLVLTSNEPIIYNTTLSTNPDEPTEIVFYSDPFSVNVPFIVYYNSSGSFTYSINYTDYTGKTSNVGLANNIQYNQYIPNSSVLFYDIKEGAAEVTIKIHNVQTSAEFTKTYYVTLVAPASGLLTNPHDEYESMDGDRVIVDTDKIIDFNASNAIIDQDTSTWTYTNKIKEVDYTAEIVNINALSSQISLDYSVRLQNAAHLHIPFTKDTYTKTFVLGKYFGFTLEISYKADYHPDDDRTILQWGSASDMNFETLVPSRGILIRDHDLYIGSTKVLTLNDDSHVNIAITFYTDQFNMTSEGNITGEGTYFIYIDGVIEAVDNISNAQILPGATNNIDFFIGASQFLNNGNTYSTNYCDMDLYRFVLYNKCLSPYEILIDYLNNLATAHFVDGKPDTTYIEDGLKRNFITYDETTKTMDSLLYQRMSSDRIGGTHFNNTEEDLTRYFNVGNFINNGKLSSILSNYEIPVPIVFLKIDGWSWSDFIAPSTGATKLEATSAQFQYYDQKQNDTMNVASDGYTINCTVSPQGTSTLADYIKNIDIEFDETTIFCPIKNWLPELKYTLKADIVDSSHSVNASIGKFINTEFGMEAAAAKGYDEFYPFSPTVRSKFVEFQKRDVAKNCFSEVNLKHGVEGFPVFVVIQFKDISKTLGIYQLILGRSSARNLGFEMIKQLTDNGLESPVVNPSFKDDKIGRYNYPLVLTNVELETETIEGVWIEFTENTPADWDHQALTLDKFEKTKFTGPFWQEDKTFYNKTSEVKLSTASGIAKDTPVTNIPPFNNFVKNIMQMPVIVKRYSTTGSGVQQYYIEEGSKYPKLQFDGSVWTQIGNETNQLVANNADDKNALFAALPLQMMQRYFILMMFFGLVDNFQKNMPIKFYKDKDGNWESMPLIGIYDTDTGLGQDNQAVASVKENMWICGITNENNNFTEKNLSDKYSTVVATGNKMWFFDCFVVNNTGHEGNNGKGSMWATAWYDFVDYMYDVRGVSLFDLANYYYENYFVKQTEGCGELLFNLTYISKYISKYATSNSANKTNQIGKLHGRRRYSVKTWLKKRVMFLHSLSYAYSPTSVRSFLEGASCTPSVSINAAIGPSLYVTTNTPVILGYSNQGSANAFVLCDANVEEPIFFGNETINFGSNFSSLSHTLTNPDQIIKLGTGYNPLYNIGFGSINTGSLCYLSEYDCSAPSKDPSNHNGLLTMSSTYMADKFCRTLYYDENDAPVKRSELRVIDFRNTYPMPGVTNYALNLEYGFDKLQELHINNSCITALTFPKNTSIRNFNIANSNIINLDINQQNFITELDLTNCAALQTLTITNCLNLNSIKIDRTNQSIQSIYVVGCPKLKTCTVTDNNSIKTISIQSPVLESIVVHDCNNLESVNVSISALKTLEIYDCNKFEKLNFIVSDKEESTLQRESVALKTFNCARTNLKYAGYGIDLNDPSLESIVDLYYFKNLTSVNVRSCSQIDYIQLHNDFDKPIPLTETFNGCTSLKRIYGHYEIRRYSKNNINGLFFDCTEYSIHGNDIRTFHGKSIYNGSTVLTPIKVLKGSNYNSVTRRELFTEGKGVTNIKLYNETNGLYYAFRNTNCTTFDVYYILNIIKTQTMDRTLTSSIELGGTFYALRTPAFDHSTRNNPDKTMFAGCEKITYMSEFVTSNPIILYGPSNNGTSVTADDGIFSPLVNIKTLSRVFSGKVTNSRWLLRRKTGNYSALTSFSWWTCGHIFNSDSDITGADVSFTSFNATTRGKVGIFTDFFVNTPNLTTINSICSYEFIKYDTIVLPEKIVNVYTSFNATYGAGNIDVNSIFPGNKIEQISSSFRVTNNTTLINDSDKCRFLIYESMFNRFSTLKILGYSLNGDSYGNSSALSFNGAGLIKEIINDAEYTTNGNIVTASDFPYLIFRKNTVLQVCAGFFEDVINAEFTKMPCLPGDTIANPQESLFLTNTYLQVASRLFRNVNFAFTLSSNGFAKLNNDSKLYFNEMFYHDLSNGSKRSKIQGCVPHRFFYHGSKRTTTSSINITDWKPWTSYAYKVEYNIPVTTCLSEAEAAVTALPIYSYIIEHIDENTNTYTYTYTDTKNKNHTVYFGTNNVGDQLQAFYACTTVNDNTVYVDPILYDKVTDEEVTTIYTNPAEDTFFGTNKTDIHGNGTTGTEVKYSVTYENPKQNVVDIDKCFYGCLGLSFFDKLLDPADFNEKNASYIPAVYTFKKEGTKWVPIDHTDEWISHEYLGFWVYNGNPDSITAFDTTNYLYLDTDALMICTDKFINWTDNLSYKPSGGQICVLNYIAAPDILRYCKNDPNTKVTGLFDHCGLDFTNQHGGYMNVDETNKYFMYGLSGRLIPYMFYNLSNIDDVSYMFRWCRCICSYKQNDKTYFIPKDMFNTYAKNVSKFVETFKGVAMQPESDIKVFSNLNQNKALDLRAMFSCVLFCPGDTKYNVNENMFPNKTISNCSGIFSAYNVTADNSTNGANTGYTICANTAHSYTAMPRQNLIFSNMFSNNKVPDSKTTFYTYYNSTVNIRNCEFIDTQIPNKNYNFESA